jgi:hypothetical protein
MGFKSKIRLILLLSCLNKSLAKCCPTHLPRSGKAANQVNCFAVLLDDGEKPYILVTGTGKDYVQGKLWYPDQRRYAGVIRIRTSYATTLNLKVIHYIGPSEVEYSGASQFWLGEATRIPHLALAMRRAWDYLTRSLFNKRSQLEVDRDKLLEYVVDEYAVSGFPFDAGSVLTNMYNVRWYSHPAANSARKRTEYLLSSLVVSGDLEHTSYYQYRVLPGAFKSLSEIQQARQRHRQSIRIQRSIILLTLGSLVAAFVQAGVIQSPPILKADCILENGVARDCNLRYRLFPDRLLDRIIRKIRGE